MDRTAQALAGLATKARPNGAPCTIFTADSGERLPLLGTFLSQAQVRRVRSNVTQHALAAVVVVVAVLGIVTKSKQRRKSSRSISGRDPSPSS